MRDNEVPQLTIQTKYNEVSKIFFYISGFRWKVGDINSKKLLNLVGNLVQLCAVDQSKHMYQLTDMMRGIHSSISMAHNLKKRDGK